MVIGAGTGDSPPPPRARTVGPVVGTRPGSGDSGLYRGEGASPRSPQASAGARELGVELVPGWGGGEGSSIPAGGG